LTTDYHSHILPNIDDGSDSIKTSLKMIKMMKQQGIGIIVATPHFYMHREASLDSYLVKRQNAYPYFRNFWISYLWKDWYSFLFQRESG
jgi:protein-tyrosine phosphatase